MYLFILLFQHYVGTVELSIIYYSNYFIYSIPVTAPTAQKDWRTQYTSRNQGTNSVKTTAFCHPDTGHLYVKVFSFTVSFSHTHDWDREPQYIHDSSSLLHF